MGYRFDNLRLEKGMYNEAGRSFTQVLELSLIHIFLAEAEKFRV